MAGRVESKASFDLLYESSREVTKKKGLAEFLHKVRGPKNDMSGKESVKQADLDQLFSKKCWRQEKGKDGHRKLKNEVTGTVVEYSNHNKMIKSGAVVTIFGQLQDHVNVLHDNVFQLNTKGWPKDPKALDYQAAQKRLDQLSVCDKESSNVEK